MGRDTDTRTDEANSALENVSRRAVLKITGAGAGIAALGGASTAGADQAEGNGTESDGESTETDDGVHFVEDLIDPTFGYPLAAGETDDVDVAHTVDAYTEEGPGDHENFPSPPESGNGGASEFPFEFAFDPVGIHVTTDDVVKFRDTAGEHTVTAFHGKFTVPQREVPMRVPDGVPGFTSPPLVDGESWLYQFPVAGVYDLFCLPHLDFGMVMRVVVSDAESGQSAADGFSGPTAGDLPPDARTVLTAPELDPARIVDEGTVAWGALTLDGSGTDAETATGTATPTGTETPTG